MSRVGKYLTVAGAKTTHLVSLLSEAIALCSNYESSFWVEWLEEDRARLEASDFRGITHLLEAFGGMGSILDLRFDTAHAASDRKDQSAVDADNARLDRLLSSIYDLAQSIKREVEH